MPGRPWSTPHSVELAVRSGALAVAVFQGNQVIVIWPGFTRDRLQATCEAVVVVKTQGVAELVADHCPPDSPRQQVTVIEQNNHRAGESVHRPRDRGGESIPAGRAEYAFLTMTQGRPD